MKSVLSAALLAAVLPLTAAADPNDEYRPFVEPLRLMLSGCLEQSWDTDSALACNELTSDACNAMGPAGVTDLGMTMCTSILTGLWDDEMDRLLPLVLAELHEPVAANLREAQVAWEAYRSAAVDFTVVDAAGGSMAAYAGSYVFMDMTAERVAHFLDILR